MRLFRFFSRPSISAVILRNEKARVRFNNPNKEDMMILLYSIVRQTAPLLGFETRQLINKLVDLDKVLAKTASVQKRDEYRAIQQAKHSRKK